MNLRYTSASLVGLIICLSVYFSTGKTNKYGEAMEMIAFRQIGHEFLWSLGDSTSTVLPVRKVSDSEYQLTFEKSISFMPDSLVKITNRIMAENKIADNYLVNLVEASSKGVVYGFIVNSGKNIIPCIGRLLPNKIYTIHILLRPSITSIITGSNYFTMMFKALLIILTLVFLWFHSNNLLKTSVAKAESIYPNVISIGKYLFYPDQLLLVYDNYQITLTEKERKLLNIFGADMNSVIGRDRLLKECWEDDGVFTTRSLDMYVSRLRKKLKNDPAVSITNIHGKGYCLKAQNA